MATLGSKLITKEQQWHANLTEHNHLGKALLIKPEMLEGTMDKLFSAQHYYSSNPLSSVLLGVPHGEKTIGTFDWEWELKGADRRPLVATEVAAEMVGNTTPGKFKEPFALILDENWWLPGDVIYPGTADKKYQARVQEGAMRKGTGYLYSLIMMGGDEEFMPAQYLLPGQQWVKLYSQYEEAANQSGSTQYSLPIAFKNTMSRYRKEYRVTDCASTEVLRVAIPGSDGNFYKSWIRYAEVEFFQQWYRELELGRWYSRSTNGVRGGTGRNVKSGPGLQQILEDSHIERYSHLTAKLIEEYLMDIFYGRVKPGKKRNIKGFTGEYGMLMFSRAMMDWMTKSGFVLNAETFTSKVSSDLNPNSLQVGFQVVKYNMANGCSLELYHNPLYDDRDLHLEVDPLTGYPIESQRITFLDFSGDSGKSNVQVIKKDKGLAFGYVQGLYGPYGPNQGGTMAHSGAYYEMHIQKDEGIHVEDVTKCGELIYSVN